MLREMKKSVVTLIVAFALSIGFTILNRVSSTSLSTVFGNNVAEILTFGTWITLSLNIATLAVFFAVFYFLAKNQKIMVVKSTIIAMVLGVVLGSAILNTIAIIQYNVYLSIYLDVLNAGASSVVYSIFQFFLPALTGLLFAELREIKSNDKLPV